MRHAFTTAVLLLSLALAAPAAAVAAPLVSKTAAMSIELPDGYQTKTKGDVLVVAQDPTGEVGVLIVVVDQANAKKALKELDARIANVFTDAKWAKPKALKLNGLSGFGIKAKAAMNGKPVELAVVVLGPTPTGKGIMIFGAVEASKKAAHKAELDAILASLKPVP